MTALRVVNIIVWGAMMAFMLPGAWNAAFGKRIRRGDPMRLACLAVAAVTVGFNVRWLIAEDNYFIWQMLYVLCAISGLYIIILGRAYGRGPYLDD